MIFNAFEAGLRGASGAVALGACLVLAAQPAFCADADPGQPGSTEQAVIEAPGMKAFIDPATGKLLASPPASAGLALSAAEKNAMSTSSDGLQEVPGPKGGTMVDLQGRFQSPLQAKIGANGKATAYHPHPFAITSGE